MNRARASVQLRALIRRDWGAVESTALRYGGAVLIVLAAAAVATLVPPYIFTILLLLAVAIGLCTWYFGRGPALFCTLVATTVIHLRLPDSELAGQGSSDLQRTGAFALAALLVIGFIGSRRTIEESLRATERRFALFTQRLPGLAWIKDPQGRYVYANDAAASAFGVQRSELYGKSDADIFPPETARQFQENDRAALASNTGVFVVETLEHADGTVHESLVSKFPIPTGLGGEVMIGGVAIDITDRRRAEAQLRATEERLRLLVESTTDYAIFMLDPNGGVASWNAGAERIHGYTSDEILGQHVSRFFAEEQGSRGTADSILDSAARDTRARYEGWRIRKDGSSFWGVVDVTALRDSDGALRGYLEVTRDVTEKRQAERALREADRRKDEFIATLSHELRNPLAPLSNGLEILRLAAIDPDQSAQVIEMMDRQIHQLSRLIDDLLDVARISTGRIQLRKEMVSLDAVVRSAIEASRPHVDARSQTLDVRLPAETITLNADAARLEQVILNLLNNASKFTDHGGSISVRAVREGPTVAISVRDSGIGIPKELAPRIFEMFYQVDQSLERSYSGMGVGLSLVRALVQMHDGTVECVSDGPGSGSEFIVRIPMTGAPALPPEIGYRAPSASCHASRLRLLVVDDNTDAVESFALLLQEMGNTVRTAYDGPEALEAARTFRPDAVMLDIGLPGMNGYEVAARMRAMPELCDTILVAVTGWGELEDLRKSREMGFAHHVVKPVSRDALRDLIAALESTSGRDSLSGSPAP